MVDLHGWSHNNVIIKIVYFCAVMSVISFLFFTQLSHKVYSLLAMPTLDEPIVVYINCTTNWSHDTVGGAVSLLPDCSKGIKSR